MGQKVHPNGFRLGIIRDWKAKWYADKQYTEFLMEDLDIRKLIEEKYKDADISMVEVDRGSNQISVTVHTAKPGIVIGRGGQRVDETRAALEKKTGKKVQLNIREVWAPELDALLVAKNIASQITNRVAYRRALKQALTRTMQRGAKGIKINIAGRLNGAEIARRECDSEGSVPLHTLRADIDYGLAEAATTMGRIGIKVWIYKGDILPEHKMDEFEEAS
ncbi:MAG: 30S ribosomal protein S3 [Chloroflexi bacterium]|nr:30S ribosomal protein S3 [Chloroflexota bacterium]MBT7081934.1 30S ribosomal protein S3 [Chloroflexota bacterium]MBT7290504.1 30S ribosomal protein S3 [Chloroflexota bacterium]